MKERISKTAGLIIGISLVIFTIGIAFLLPKENVLDWLMIILAGIFGVYAGYALSDSMPRKDIYIEMTNIIMGFTLLLLGVIITPYFLAAGYFWHGIWDVIHHKKVSLVKIDVPEWYIYGCIIYDWAIGIFLIWWLSV